MDTATRKVLESHNADLRAVQETLEEHSAALADVKSALSVMHSILTRVELTLKGLPCHSEPPCDESTPAEVPIAKRRLRAATG